MIDYFQKHKNRIAEEYLQCDIMYIKSENLQNNTKWCFKTCMYIW